VRARDIEWLLWLEPNVSEAEMKKAVPHPTPIKGFMDADGSNGPLYCLHQ
jgi:hypothetical protein